MKLLATLLLSLVLTVAPAQQARYVWWGAIEVTGPKYEEMIGEIEACVSTTRPEGHLKIIEVEAVLVQEALPEFDTLYPVFGFYQNNTDTGEGHIIVFTRGERADYTMYHEALHYVTQLPDGIGFDKLLEYCIGPEPEF